MIAEVVQIVGPGTEAAGTRTTAMSHVERRPKVARAIPGAAPRRSGRAEERRPGPREEQRASRHGLVIVLLALATLAVFAQAVRFPFLWDDFQYVTTNSAIHAGLTAHGVEWAFTTGYAFNWHPVTWTSHMVDCQLFGLDPRGHHATNVLIHLLNVILLFELLRRATGDLWPSAAVAALFAVHPLRAESVAWVAERKDVLSACFGLLAMIAYAAYARTGGARRYLATALMLALSLMTKPMMVTLPFVLLLLDYWPLGRLKLGRDGGRGESSPATRRETPAGQRPVAYLVVEKLPLMLLSVASCAVTVLIQERGGAVLAASRIGLSDRLANAVVAYVRYIWKAVWPADLAVHYWHPSLPGGASLTTWQVAGALALLVATTAVLLSLVRCPFLAVGWLWFLGMLVPTIGIVQVGLQAMADRYTYLPLVGVFIAVCWAGQALAAKVPRARALLAVVAVGVTLAYGVAGWRQTRLWRDPVALYTRSLEVEPRNPIVHSLLGMELGGRNAVEEAVPHYRAALEVWPEYVDARFNLGVALAKLNRVDEAIPCYERVLELDPRHAQAHNNLASALLSKGRVEQAIAHYRKALELDPAAARTWYNLGVALTDAGRPVEAVAAARACLRLDSGSVGAMSLLAWHLATASDPATRAPEEALRLARHAAELTGNRDAQVLDTLAAALAATGQLDDAMATARQALGLASAQGRSQLAGQIRQRLELYEQGRAVAR
jgi:protein O-mannosyl-transferase